jgi:hypothetical protein
LATSFNEQLDQHGTWRREFALRLKLLAEWMNDQDLLDSAVQERLKRLESQLRTDKVMVAFVAEFSRGKSEMINAIFFAGYGRRIMPASAGRTTMCPTEMSYDAEVPPCLRLLPIETRLQPQALMEWRMVPEQWERVDLDVDNPQQLAAAFERVSQTRKVTPDEARALGFWHNQAPEDNPLVDSEGLVEVPRWRHALINIAHPLLKQGLVILDTPGLNAIGAEPELTLSLIPQAQAVVFILGADTGVTKSDLAIWREHLISETTGTDARLVVLNKIDTLWDELSTPAQIAAQIERQKASTAEILGLYPEQVIAVSAQKGLVAKVNRDEDLLRKSCLGQLEDALGDGMLLTRQRTLGQLLHNGIAELRAEAGRVIHTRRRDCTEQSVELQGLRGKNTAVIRHMRGRIAQEQVDFDLGGARLQALRSVHLKLLKEVFGLLGSRVLKGEMVQLKTVLAQKGLKLGVKKAYAETFDGLRANFAKVQGLSAEMHSMLSAMFKQLNTEYGFSLQPIKEPDLNFYLNDFELAQRSHLQYLGLGNIFKLAQPEFADRLVRALYARIRSIHEAALGEVEFWSKSSAAQLDSQLRERRRSFARRMEAVDRIQQAAGGLDARIAELAQQDAALEQLEHKLTELTAHLMDASPPAVARLDLELV